MTNGALQGLRVIEMGSYVAIPTACTFLGDWGADVIKIEDPKGGDPTRGFRNLENIMIGDINPMMEQFNRNRRSLALDTKHEQSCQVLHKLVQSADVFATNFRPRHLKTIKADYDSLSMINPNLIYCLFSGYGSSGRDKDKPAFDYSAFWARSGVMDRLTEPGGVPRPARPGFGDNVSSIAIAGAIAAALFARERTGEGQLIELNLYQIGVWVSNVDIQVALHYEQEINQSDRKASTNPLWNYYKAKDGKWIMLVMPQTDLVWPAFCEAIGKPEMASDVELDSHEKRIQKHKTLIPMIDDVVSGKTSSDWEEIFERHGLIYDIVRSPLDVASDPQAWENDFFAEIDHPGFNKLKVVQNPIKFSKTPSSLKSCAPELGQHTEEVLLELGYTWNDIVEFKNTGIIL